MPTITLNLSAIAATRLRAAIAETLDLTDDDGESRDATANDVKGYIIGDLKQLIRTSERRVAAKVVAPGPEPTIT